MNRYCLAAQHTIPTHQISSKLRPLSCCRCSFPSLHNLIQLLPTFDLHNEAIAVPSARIISNHLIEPLPSTLNSCSKTLDDGLQRIYEHAIMQLGGYGLRMHLPSALDQSGEGSMAVDGPSFLGCRKVPPPLPPFSDFFAGPED